MAQYSTARVVDVVGVREHPRRTACAGLAAVDVMHGRGGEKRLPRYTAADRDGFMPPEVTVIFTDGTERVFNPGDQILIGPTISD